MADGRESRPDIPTSAQSSPSGCSSGAVWRRRRQRLLFVFLVVYKIVWCMTSRVFLLFTLCECPCACHMCIAGSFGGKSIYAPFVLHMFDAGYPRGHCTSMLFIHVGWKTFKYEYDRTFCSEAFMLPSFLNCVSATDPRKHEFLICNFSHTSQSRMTQSHRHHPCLPPRFGCILGSSGVGWLRQKSFNNDLEKSLRVSV